MTDIFGFIFLFIVCPALVFYFWGAIRVGDWITDWWRRRDRG